MVDRYKVDDEPLIFAVPVRGWLCVPYAPAHCWPRLYVRRRPRWPTDPTFLYLEKVFNFYPAPSFNWAVMWSYGRVSWWALRVVLWVWEWSFRPPPPPNTTRWWDESPCVCRDFGFVATYRNTELFAILWSFVFKSLRIRIIVMYFTKCTSDTWKSIQ